MNFAQATLVAFLGGDAKTKTTKNGTTVVNFSVATNSSWTDSATGERKERTQWVEIVAYGEGYGKLAERLVKGAHVFIQGELQVREFEKTIKVKVDGKTVDHKIKQTAVEVNAKTIRLLDRSRANEDNAAANAPEDEVPY